MLIKSYEDLDVWKKSIDLVIDVYKIIKRLPREELYALSDQIRRAVVSIPSNIAEGQQRQSTRDYLKFLSIARGSLGELKTQLIICERLGYLSSKEIEPLFTSCDQVGRLLQALIRSLTNKLNLESNTNCSIYANNQSPAPRPKSPATKG